MDDLRVQYNEEAVGANHPTKADTLNRLMLVEHEMDGTHDAVAMAAVIAASGALMNVVEDTSPQLGGNLDMNKKSILLSATLSDHEYEGIVKQGVAGENFSRGDHVYCKLNGGAWKWYKYDCNGTDKLILGSGIAVADATTGNACSVLTDGQMRDDTWSLSPSADTAVTVYASATAGGITLTAPSTSGDENYVVGFLVGGNTLLLKTGFAWIER